MPTLSLLSPPVLSKRPEGLFKVQGDGWYHDHDRQGDAMCDLLVGDCTGTGHVCSASKSFWLIHIHIVKI